jgi:hypothetical protein
MTPKEQISSLGERTVVEDAPPLKLDKKVVIKESELNELAELLQTYKDAILGHEERIAALEAALALLIVKGRKAARGAITPARMDIPQG